MGFTADHGVWMGFTAGHGVWVGFTEGHGVWLGFTAGHGVWVGFTAGQVVETYGNSKAPNSAQVEVTEYARDIHEMLTE